MFEFFMCFGFLVVLPIIGLAIYGLTKDPSSFSSTNVTFDEWELEEFREYLKRSGIDPSGLTDNEVYELAITTEEKQLKEFNREVKLSNLEQAARNGDLIAFEEWKALKQETK